MSDPKPEPVTLHKLMHELTTTVGSRPRLLPDGGLATIPIRVNLYRHGEQFPFAVADVDGWELVTYRPAVRDGKTGNEVSPERPGVFILMATVPVKPEPAEDTPRDPEPRPDANDHSATGGGYAPAPLR